MSPFLPKFLNFKPKFPHCFTGPSSSIVTYLKKNIFALPPPEAEAVFQNQLSKMTNFKYFSLENVGFYLNGVRGLAH